MSRPLAATSTPVPTGSTSAAPAEAVPAPAPVALAPGLPAVVARSLYRTLRDRGFTPQQIVSVSSELIGLVTTELTPTKPDLKS